MVRVWPGAGDCNAGPCCTAALCHVHGHACTGVLYTVQCTLYIIKPSMQPMYNA